MAEQKAYYTSADLVSLIRDRYTGRQTMPEYAVLPQVRSGRGFASGRTADVIVMSLWPSRGLEIMGFEIKVSRGDWLRELKDPSKADELARFCDRWWVVAPKGVVLPRGLRTAVLPLDVEASADSAVLPAGWGLMEVEEGGKALRVVKQAPKLNAEAVDRHFVANLLLQAQRFLLDDTEREEIRSTAYNRGKEDGAQHERRLLGREGDESTQRLMLLREIEKSAGVDLRNEWDAEKVGEALAIIYHAKGAEFVSRLGMLHSGVASMLAVIEDVQKGEPVDYFRRLQRPAKAHNSWTG